MHYPFPQWMFVHGSDSHCFTLAAGGLSAGDQEGMATAYPGGDAAELSLDSREEAFRMLAGFENLRDDDKVRFAAQVGIIEELRGRQ